ncbi:hypothetical protein BafACA1_0454 [Borreliella afzelii ACA-1]|nr:hypothetical protein BafACA1_0454 [Borreliella afzelii ACA-1]
MIDLNSIPLLRCIIYCRHLIKEKIKLERSAINGRFRQD